ncbi:histone-lysine N-methyltransferase SETMAR [Elysia marginata]|uniref:Histone-lysine N-methyltransferase SETMAR n=1 Tax=Elysia marginata TaxID=1093978 RepID=A0AAV4FT19_9GAST|nr:histone-lysine N-methyltransferase SETMAR [Elysia marginata]
MLITSDKDVRAQLMAPQASEYRGRVPQPLATQWIARWKRAHPSTTPVESADISTGILFHHDNAPVHTARSVTDILAGYEWELLEHPRYSPDLAPCDFHLFPKMKEHLCGQRFETEEDIIQARKVAIKNLDKGSYVTALFQRLVTTDREMRQQWWMLR